MSHWKTTEVINLICTVPNVTSVQRHDQGGDCDTTNLVVRLKGTTERIHVCGFVTNGNAIEFEKADDTSIEMIEVSDGQDSKGGLSSSNRFVCVAYAEIVALLRRHGHTVVPSLKDYF